MGVSENSGTPKSSILIGFSIINHPIWGTPIFGNTHIVIIISNKTVTYGSKVATNWSLQCVEPLDLKTLLAGSIWNTRNVGLRDLKSEYFILVCWEIFDFWQKLTWSHPVTIRVKHRHKGTYRKLRSVDGNLSVVRDFRYVIAPFRSHKRSGSRFVCKKNIFSFLFWQNDTNLIWWKIDGRHPKQPPTSSMYKTPQVMWYLLYQLVIARFLNHQPVSPSISTQNSKEHGIAHLSLVQVTYQRRASDVAWRFPSCLSLSENDEMNQIIHRFRLGVVVFF